MLEVFRGGRKTQFRLHWALNKLINLTRKSLIVPNSHSATPSQSKWNVKTKTSYDLILRKFHSTKIASFVHIFSLPRQQQQQLLVDGRVLQLHDEGFSQTFFYSIEQSDERESARRFQDDGKNPENLESLLRCKFFSPRLIPVLILHQLFIVSKQLEGTILFGSARSSSTLSLSVPQAVHNYCNWICYPLDFVSRVFVLRLLLLARESPFHLSLRWTREDFFLR